MFMYNFNSRGDSPVAFECSKSIITQDTTLIRILFNLSNDILLDTL